VTVYQSDVQSELQSVCKENLIFAGFTLFPPFSNIYRHALVMQNTTDAQWRLPEKKRISTQEKSDFAIALRFSKHKYQNCAQT